PKRPWGYASLGVGIAAIGTGVALNLLLVGEYEVGGACTGGGYRHGWGLPVFARHQVAELALGLVGGALVTLGVAVLLTTSKGKGKGKAKKEKGGKAKAGLQVAPSGIRF
ncbi:MAG: hypothetical protein HC927_12805, partial [Deltaproteobacteria bacterium]|nr:hypothetical protein [Deltaproteobacteria bacterium]